MTQEERLIRNLKQAVGPAPISVYQGIVVSVEGITCTVRFGTLDVSGIRLRASETADDAQMLIVPRKDSAVIVGSLSGDLSKLVVLSVDAVERIEINGGKLGGLINIETLTEKVNELVKAFNSHTHVVPALAVTCGGSPNANPFTVPAIMTKSPELSASDYEDTTVKH